MYRHYRECGQGRRENEGGTDTVMLCTVARESRMRDGEKGEESMLLSIALFARTRERERERYTCVADAT